MSGSADNSAPSWLREGWPHVWMPYTQMAGAPLPMPAVATEGVHIELADGTRLVDGIASWWTACHGYRHPHLVQAVKAQLDAMPHVMFGGLGHEPAFTLARRLAGVLPGDLDHVFFSDSGSVSVEVAMKMALQYWLNKGVEGRSRFVSFRYGYHGDTVGAMSVCDPEEGMHRVFSGLLPRQYIVDLPRSRDELADFDSFLRRHQHAVAAVIVEPLVQGAGGMKMHDGETLAALVETARRYGLLVIADEVFTGFGRTGTMFACEQGDVVPDIMCLSKALTGGVMGLAATAARREVFEAFLGEDAGTALMHGPTFMANPLGCAAANASLDLFEREPRLAQVAALEKALAVRLEDCRAVPGVIDVRVLGAIGAVQIEDMGDLLWLRRRFIEEGVWLRPFGDIVYLTPAFIIGEDDLDRLTGAILTVLRQWAGRR